jgi:hypothetical protein
MPVTEQQLADLRAARKVLAINAASTAGGRCWIHPRFQFDGIGQPFVEIAQVIEAFGDADPIAVCDWFAEPNPLLDNHPPMKFWLTDRARVVQAARRSGLGSFLDDWEAKHGELTPEELARATKELAVTPKCSPAHNDLMSHQVAGSCHKFL